MQLIEMHKKLVDSFGHGKRFFSDESYASFSHERCIAWFEHIFFDISGDKVMHGYGSGETNTEKYEVFDNLVGRPAVACEKLVELANRTIDTNIGI